MNILVENVSSCAKVWNGTYIYYLIINIPTFVLMGRLIV